MLVGIGFITGGLRYGFGSWHQPGAGLLPVVFGAVLVILSSILFIVSFIAGAKPEKNRFWEAKGSWRTVLAVALCLFGYMAVFKELGFILTTFLFLFFLLKFIGKKGWIISISLSLVISFFCYGFFSHLLGTPLPKGQIYGSALRASARV
jgi:putative tricarboxylic transport membrane protein